MKNKVKGFVGVCILFLPAACSFLDQSFHPLEIERTKRETCRSLFSKYSAKEKVGRVLWSVFPLTQKGVCRAKVGSRVVSLELDGSVIRYAELEKNERKAHWLKYGVLSPRLFGKVKEAEGPLGVCLWLNHSHRLKKDVLSLHQRVSPSQSSNRKRALRQKRRELAKKMLFEKRAFRQKLRAQGIRLVRPGRTQAAIPMFRIFATPEQIARIAKFKEVARLDLCPARSGGRPLMNTEAMRSTKIEYTRESYLYPFPGSISPEITLNKQVGKYAILCQLEGSAVHYPHDVLAFHRRTPASPGNSTNVIDSASGWQYCIPQSCSSDADCTWDYQKPSCRSGRCASATTCSSNEQCQIYGESCQNNLCQEACPNTMFPLGSGQHATMVASPMNACDTSSSMDCVAPRIGGVPGATLFSANTGPEQGASKYDDGYLWCSIKGAHIINQSYVFENIDSSPGANGKVEDYTWAKFADWYAYYYGILTIAGAGNHGVADFAHNSSMNNLTVGGYMHMGTQAWTDDLHYLANSKNPLSPFGDLHRPDLLGPASGLTVTTKSGWSSGEQGTSLATPFISGLAAQLVSYSYLKTLNYEYAYLAYRPQALRAILKTSACNRVQSLPESKIGGGGVDANVALNVLYNSISVPENRRRLGHLFLYPPQDFNTSSWGTGFYRWGQSGRHEIPCWDIANGNTIRASIAWERPVGDYSTPQKGSASQTTYATKLDLDLMLYEESLLDPVTREPPTSSFSQFVKASRKYDDTSETLSWTNNTGATKRVCMQVFKASSLATEYYTRMGWAVSIYNPYWGYCQ